MSPTCATAPAAPSSELRAGEVEALIDGGDGSGGMIPKLRAGATAAAAGVRCHIVDGRERTPTGVLDGASLGTGDRNSARGSYGVDRQCSA